MTEHSRKAETAEAADRLCLQIIDGIGTGIIVSQDGRLLFANRTVRDISGYDERELTARSVADLFHPEDARRLETQMLAADEGQSISRGHRLRILTKSGSARWVWSQASRKSVGGKPALMISLVDCDAMVQDAQEEARERLFSVLNRSQRMEAIGILAGGIAHEFNNILSIIRGYNEIALMEAEPSSKQRDHLLEALKAGNRAAGLVQQILTFSREAEQPRQALHLTGLFKEGMRFLRASLPATIAIDHRIPKDLLPVWGDPTRILQVLMNLCVNAAQAMGDTGGVLSVALENVTPGVGPGAAGERTVPGPHVRLTVRDTGPGIPPEVIGRIFDPDFTTKAACAGSGLGLAIVQGIVRDHGGDVSVQSTPGSGATFSVLLPSGRPASREGECPSVELPEGAGRILFVDDEPAIERLGRLMLQRLGYEVESRTDSIEALELFIRKPQAFDLVITDLTMPGMRGDQLAEKIKGVRPDVPVILCTGYNDLVPPEGDDRRPFDRCLIKPVGMSSLAAAVRELLKDGARSAQGPR